MSVVEKVRRLVALAASDSTEEARTAAYQACRLIREHGIVLVAKGEAPQEKSSPSSWGNRYTSSPWGSPFSDLNRDFEEILRRAQQERARKDAQERARQQARENMGYPPRGEAYTSGEGFVCYLCKGPIHAGTAHRWHRGMNLRLHLDCNDTQNNPEKDPQPTETADPEKRVWTAEDKTLQHLCSGCSYTIGFGTLHRCVRTRDYPVKRYHFGCEPPGT